MIKYLLGVITALAIIGGALDFDSDEESWRLIINKKQVLSSVQDGTIRIFNQGKKILSSSDAIETSTLTVEN
ncbi:MAG TPA: hypothetical protein QF725_02095 [Gammaproteobacteria bacterium]|jgi:hypothetical protein|nr:hypothetical protein [Gammaproteobacteria bacterium]|tara:strand:- start:480 stop:695 length:216 start_codon:yes stop_codon:yes gene_type:complete